MAGKKKIPSNNCSISIVSLLEHRHHAMTAAQWIYEEWGMKPLEEGLAILLDDSPLLPPALLAMSHDLPVGVLGFKYHQLQGQMACELWINVLYVHEAWRKLGIGSRLLQHGMQTARGYERERLFVYTDIPELYEKHAWLMFRQIEDTPYSVLRFPLA